jgi:hypothetical protein
VTVSTVKKNNIDEISLEKKIESKANDALGGGALTTSKISNLGGGGQGNVNVIELKYF